MAKNISLLGVDYESVPAVELPQTGGGTATFYDDTGTLSITENGVYNVIGKASAEVNVSGGVTPTGTLSVTQNGTYDVTNYASANVNVSGGTDDKVVNVCYDRPYGTTVSNKLVGTSITGYANVAMVSTYNTEYINNKYGGLSTAINSQWAKLSTNRPKFKGIIFERPDASYDVFSGGTSNYPFHITMGSSSYTEIVFSIVIKRNIRVFSLNLSGTYAESASIKSGHYIYVPDNLVSSYKSATNWSKFASSIKPLSKWEYYGIY